MWYDCRLFFQGKNMSNRVKIKFIGKLIGVLIGVFLLGWIGAILGLFIGHIFDRVSVSFRHLPKAEQTVYLRNFFALLGYLAKRDGQVSANEIAYARKVMRRFHLTEQHAEQAMKAFYDGKRFTEAQVEDGLRQLRSSVKGRSKLLYVFINTQVQMAYADGIVKDELKPVLQHMAKTLGLGQLNFGYYDAIFGWQQRFNEQQTGGGSSSYSQFQRPGGFGTSAAAYKELGLSSKASDAEVKKAYRKLMSKYHPDKLMSKGLSEAEMKAATEKVQRIKAAYEQIRKGRGL